MLGGSKSQSTADSKAILDRHWRRIDTLVETQPQGPWMQAVTEQ